MYLQFLSHIYMHVYTLVRVCDLKAINIESESEFNNGRDK